MEYKRLKDRRDRPFHIHDDGQKAMVIDGEGLSQSFGKRHLKIGTLEDAVEYLAERPWGYTIIKLDTIKASLL